MAEVGPLVACRQFCNFLIIGFPVSGATIDRFQMTYLTLASNVGDGLLLIFFAAPTGQMLRYSVLRR